MIKLNIEHDKKTLASAFGISDERLKAIVEEFNELCKNNEKKKSLSLEVASIVCNTQEELVCISFMLGEMAFAQHGRQGPIVLKLKP